MVFGKWSSGLEYMFNTTSSTQTTWYTRNTVNGYVAQITFNTPPANQWNHLAAVSYSGVTTVYVNGVSVGSVTNNGTQNNNTGSAFQIGHRDTDTTYWTGNISNLRVTPGLAIYTTDFTIPYFELGITQDANSNGNPSSAITSSTQVALMLNAYQGASYLTDFSTNNYTVTNNGGATSNALSPFVPLPSPSVTVTPSQSVTPTMSVTVTPSVTPSVSVTPSISVTPSLTPTESVTPTQSGTPSVSVTASVSVTPSQTPAPSSSPSITPTESVTPSA